jgi:amidase
MAGGYRARWARFFRDFDVLLCPVMPTDALQHDHSEPAADRTVLVDGRPFPYWDQVAWAGAITAAYLPAVAAPIGRTRHGMPVGVQIVAPYLRDRTAIDFARQLADVVGGFEPPPGFSPAASARALGENAEGYQLCLLAQRSAQRWNGNRFSRSPLPSGVRP